MRPPYVQGFCTHTVFFRTCVVLPKKGAYMRLQASCLHSTTHKNGSRANSNHGLGAKKVGEFGATIITRRHGGYQGRPPSVIFFPEINKKAFAQSSRQAAVCYEGSVTILLLLCMRQLHKLRTDCYRVEGKDSFARKNRR